MESKVRGPLIWAKHAHSTSLRNGFTLIDSQGRIIGGGASPRDPTWAQVTLDASNAVKQARNIARFSDKQKQHRRGSFPAMAAGISYGGGQTQPMTLRSSPENAAAMGLLMGSPSIRRIAGLQSKLLHTIAPRLGAYYRDTLDALVASDSGLTRNFRNSDFACMTANFGPNTITIDHTDFANLATGLCAITALGSFDSNIGGHLILWDLKLIIEFPPGATILIPSALLRHSNAPIQSGEQRFSLTQYSAGGLFRWVENGFCKNRDRRPPRKEPEQDDNGRWEQGLGMFDMAP